MRRQAGWRESGALVSHWLLLLFSGLFWSVPRLLVSLWSCLPGQQRPIATAGQKRSCIYWQELDDPLAMEELTPSAYEQRSGLLYRPSLAFENRLVRWWVMGRCSRLYRAGRVERHHLWHGALWGKQLLSGQVAPVSIGWVDGNKGWGLFAKEALDKGRLIGEYGGLLKLIAPFFANVNGYCFLYPMARHSFLWFAVDGLRQGDITSFLNHADQPNCQACVLFVQGIYRIVVVTQRPILQGEELTFDYGPTLWGMRSF